MLRRFPFRQIGLAPIVCLLALLGLTLPVHALVLSIDQPNQFASPGETVIFTGTIKNDTGFPLDAATDLFVNTFNYDPTVFSPPPDQLLGNPDFTLPDGATSADVALFDVNIDSSATVAGSPYLADVTISDSFGDISNDVTISIAVVPEPGSASLLFAGLALLIGFTKRRTLMGALSRYSVRLALAGFALFLTASAQAAVTPVQLVTLNGATSVWGTDPTKVGVELQIGNSGSAAANSVNVTNLTVQGGLFSGPQPLPVALGTINAGDDQMLDFVISVPTTNGTKAYRLTISGNYMYSGTLYGFSLNWSVTPNSAGPGTITPINGVATIQNPNTATFPPPPTQPPFSPNAETPNFVPIGPPTGPLFPPTPTGTGVGPSSGGASVQIPVNTTHGSGPGVPPDPNAAAEGGGVALATYNTGISYSIDGGAHFTDVNLFNPIAGRSSFFPQSDGGLCCDQVVIYLPPPTNLFVWMQQYWPITACATNCGLKTQTNKITQPDRERIAWATPAAIKADFNNAWTYIDLTANASSGSSGLGAANNEWVDYPDLAWSNTYLYFMVDHGFPSPGKVYTGQRIIARLSLADMLNASASTVNYQYATITGSAGLNKDHIVQQAPGKMVFASLDNSSTLRVFTWEDSGNNITNSTVGITNINQGSNYTSVAPDGIDWLASSFPGNITGAVYRQVAQFGLPAPPPQDQYVFAFDAGVNGSGRPQSYVRLENLTPSGGGWSAVEEYDIFNPNYAFAMAALGRDNNNVTPEIGITLAVGGGTVGYPQNSVGFKDDFVVFQVTSSNATQSFQNSNGTSGARFGDYFAARYIDGSASQFAAEAYDVTLPAGSPSGSTCISVGCTATMRFIQFGRPPPTQPK
jgi:hypothetical protein